MTAPVTVKASNTIIGPMETPGYESVLVTVNDEGTANTNFGVRVIST
jgi:hypothetical protein